MVPTKPLVLIYEYFLRSLLEKSYNVSFRKMSRRIGNNPEILCMLTSPFVMCYEKISTPHSFYYCLLWCTIVKVHVYEIVCSIEEKIKKDLYQFVECPKKAGKERGKLVFNLQIIHDV